MRALVALLAFLIVATAGLTSCTFTNEQLNDGAYLVNNAQDLQPISGAHVEIESTKDEGATYEILAQTSTDAFGYFYFDESAPDCFDCWTKVYVYEDSTKLNRLGEFEFHSASENVFSKKILHLDTFTLAHHVVLVPRVAELPEPVAVTMTMDYREDLFNSPMQSASNVQVGYTFEPIAAEFNMQLQHWLRYGSAALAYGNVFSSTGNQYQGDFVVEQPRMTKEGDTVYIDFRPHSY